MRRKTNGSRKSSVWVLGILLLLLTGGLAQATDIYVDTTIDSGTWPGNTNVYDTATLTVRGGDITSISAYNSCIVDVNGGTIGTIFLYNLEQATINLYGGALTGFHGIFEPSNAINIYGYNFTVWQDGQDTYLSGLWGDNTEFEFYFLRSEELPDIVTLYTVPEPLTISLLAFGGILIFHNRKL
jgi:hypothetical protein